jgi:Cu-Zn family superoxide dismutase
MPIRNRLSYFGSLLNTAPRAIAIVRGSSSYPDIYGEVRFYQTVYGTFVVTEFTGLPTGTSDCSNPVFGFHIHNGSQCTGNFADPFADTLTHYNPYNCNHPYHAGDLPPLFSANGYAFSTFLTTRFSASEIIGRTVVLHSMPDDFTSQPAGNSGAKIACGMIVAR